MPASSEEMEKVLAALKMEGKNVREIMKESQLEKKTVNAALYLAF